MQYSVHIEISPAASHFSDLSKVNVYIHSGSVCAESTHSQTIVLILYFDSSHVSSIKKKNKLLFARKDRSPSEVTPEGVEFCATCKGHGPETVIC